MSVSGMARRLAAGKQPEQTMCKSAGDSGGIEPWMLTMWSHHPHVQAILKQTLYTNSHKIIVHRLKSGCASSQVSNKILWAWTLLVAKRDLLSNVLTLEQYYFPNVLFVTCNVKSTYCQ